MKEVLYEVRCLKSTEDMILDELQHSYIFSNCYNLQSVHFGYIIGDAAYPLKTWLLTGFKDNGHLTA